jgi:hypothetical protein
MLGSISPLGERARRSRWGLTVAAHVVGSGATGALLGAVLGGLGRVVLGGLGVSAAARLIILAALVATGLAFDAGVLGVELPTSHRQVDDRWLGIYRGWVYGLGFGAQLGLGIVTVVITSAVYSTFAAAFLSGSIGGGAVVGAVFGVARASTLLAAARVKTPAGVVAVDSAFQRWERSSGRASNALVATLALTAVAAAVASLA